MGIRYPFWLFIYESTGLIGWFVFLVVAMLPRMEGSDMASEFTQAIMARALARRDEETLAAVEYIKADAEQLRDEVRVSKATTIDLIHQKLAQATDQDAPPAVLVAYEKLLAQVTG